MSAATRQSSSSRRVHGHYHLPWGRTPAALRQTIIASGYRSQAAWARAVAKVHPVTVSRWLHGQLPKTVQTIVSPTNERTAQRPTHRPDGTRFPHTRPRLYRSRELRTLIDDVQAWHRVAATLAVRPSAASARRQRTTRRALDATRLTRRRAVLSACRAAEVWCTAYLAAVVHRRYDYCDALWTQRPMVTMPETNPSPK